jgi:hypothetical protein
MWHTDTARIAGALREAVKLIESLYISKVKGWLGAVSVKVDVWRD